MRGVLSREQAREFDLLAVARTQMPSVLLMENAGRGAAEKLLALRNGNPGFVLVLAGPGNNGGDGFVLARRLLVLGHAVEVWLIGEQSKLIGDAKVMWEAYRGLGGAHCVLSDAVDLPRLKAAIGAANVIVDALFGTGLTRAIDGLYARVIEATYGCSAFVYALDIPSGLDTNRGRALGVAVRAHATVTFGAEKLGHFTTAGVDYGGQLEVVDIGVPADLHLQSGHSAERYEAQDLAPRLAHRRASSHKGRAGRVAIIAGHAGTSGAALLAARGALRAGAGLVTHVGLPKTIGGIEPRVLEAMTHCLDPLALEQSVAQALQGMDAAVLGPGLGLGAEERRIVAQVIEQAPMPVVVDADALTKLSEEPSLLKHARGPRILLPHPGELGRLLHITTAEVVDDPFGAVRRAVENLHAIVVLKSAYTLVGAPNQKKTAIVGSPCAAMGTGGSGDVLSGVIAALLVEHEPQLAALLGVHLHGRAGILWARALGADRGLVASEIADHLPQAFAELSRAGDRLTV